MTDAWAEVDYDFVVVDPAEVTSPRTVGFLDHCRRVQGENPFPRWSDFRIHHLANDVIPFVSVVDVARDPTVFTYRYWGTGHTDLKGVDMTGKRVADIPAPDLARIGIRQFQMVLAQRRALVFLHTLKAYGEWKNQVQVAVRVPFAEDGATIDKVVSYSNYADDRRQWTDIYRSLIPSRK